MIKLENQTIKHSDESDMDHEFVLRALYEQIVTAQHRKETADKRYELLAKRKRECEKKTQYIRDRRVEFQNCHVAMLSRVVSGNE